MRTTFEAEGMSIVDRTGVQDVFATAVPRVERLPGNCVRLTFCAQHSASGSAELEIVAQVVMPLVAVTGLWLGINDPSTPPAKLAS